MAEIEMIEGMDIQELMANEYQRYLNTGDDSVKDRCIKNIVELSKLIQEDNKLLLEMEKENNRERELETHESEVQDRKDIENRKLDIEERKMEAENTQHYYDGSSKKADRVIKCIEIGIPVATTILGAVMTNAFLNKTMIFEANGNIYGRDVASKATMKMFDGFARKISSIK